MNRQKIVRDKAVFKKVTVGLCCSFTMNHKLKGQSQFGIVTFTRSERLCWWWGVAASSDFIRLLLNVSCQLILTETSTAWSQPIKHTSTYKRVLVVKLQKYVYLFFLFLGTEGAGELDFHTWNWCKKKKQCFSQPEHRGRSSSPHTAHTAHRWFYDSHYIKSTGDTFLQIHFIIYRSTFGLFEWVSNVNLHPSITDVNFLSGNILLFRRAKL